MDFWMVFLCICLSFVLLEEVVGKKYRNIVAACFMIFITFISAFRYRIGYDYQSYEVLFYNAEIENISMEPTFNFLVTFFREAGLAPQAMFATYSILMYGLVWKGLKYYLPEESLSLKIILLVINTTTWGSLFWQSASNIRHMLATAIFFYCSRYIIERKFLKYALCIMLATTVHYSAVFLIPFYWLLHKNFNKYLLIGVMCICGFIYYMDMTRTFISIIMNYLNLYESYSYATSQFDRFFLGKQFFLELVMIIIVICFRKKTYDGKQEILTNAYIYTFIIVILLAWSSPLTRMANYLVIFRGLFLLNIVRNFDNNAKTIINTIMITIMILLFIRYTYVITPNMAQVRPDLLSGGNMDYTFNFFLFQ